MTAGRQQAGALLVLELFEGPRAARLLPPCCFPEPRSAEVWGRLFSTHTRLFIAGRWVASVSEPAGLFTLLGAGGGAGGPCWLQEGSPGEGWGLKAKDVPRSWRVHEPLPVSVGGWWRGAEP